MKPDYEKFERRPPPTLPLDRRIGIAEVEKDYPSRMPEGRRIAASSATSARCLTGTNASFAGDAPMSALNIACAWWMSRICAATPSCRQAFLARYGRVPGRGEQGAIIKDETRCIRCGLCAVRCPTGAITMERVELMPA
jgi:formate dehydrogenase (NADP+) beta subunit